MYKKYLFSLTIVSLIGIASLFFYLRWHSSVDENYAHPNLSKKQPLDVSETHKSTRKKIAASSIKHPSVLASSSQDASDTRQRFEMPQQSEEIEARVASLAPPPSEAELTSQIPVPKEHEETIEEAETILYSLHEQREETMQALEEQMQSVQEQSAVEEGDGETELAIQEDEPQDQAEESLDEEEVLEKNDE